MPALPIKDASETLARAVETAAPSTLAEVRSELFPEQAPPAPLTAVELARHIRSGLEPEELVDLWNVLFPEDNGVYYNEETDALHFNEEVAGYAD